MRVLILVCALMFGPAVVQAEKIVYLNTHADQKACLVEMEVILREMAMDSKVTKTFDEPNHSAAIVINKDVPVPATVVCV